MTIKFATIALLVLPVSIAAAQNPPAAPTAPTAPQANALTAVFKGRTLALQRNLAQAFDSIPASKFGYKPTPAQLSIGYIAQHLATDNYLFCDRFGAMQSSRPAKDTATADSVKATWPRDTLIAKLKESFKFCEDALNQLDDSKLSEQVTLTFGGNSRQVLRGGMALGHVIDLADHYSQIANYMRLNNMIPPTALPRPRTNSP